MTSRVVNANRLRMFHDDKAISEGAGGKSKSADDPSVALFAPARTLADCTNQAEKIPMDLSEWRKFLRHPLSEAWGDMSEVEFEGLVADMKQHGFDQKQQVWLFEGRVLDGWHRLRAAVLTNKQPTFENYKGDDAEGFVIRRNLMRRHLDTSQRGMVAGRLANLKRGGDRRSGEFQTAKLPIEKTAEQLHVSVKTAAAGKKVAEKGSEELQEAVINGTVSVSDAASVADAPKAEQRKAVAAVREGKEKTVKAAVARKPKQGRVIFDDRQIETMIGKLTRLFDQRYAAHGKKHPKHHDDCIRPMGLVLAAWKRWLKESV